MSKSLDETVRLQSEKMEERIREVKEDRLQGIAKGRSGETRAANSSNAAFPSRNECWETHCSLVS